MRANADAGCMPMLPIEVNFSTAVPRAQALAIRLTAKDGTVYTPQPPPTDRQPSVDQVVFKGPFPEAGTLTVSLPPALKDDAGRTLENADRFPLELGIDEFPPLVKFSGEFGILEPGRGG